MEALFSILKVEKDILYRVNVNTFDIDCIRYRVQYTQKETSISKFQETDIVYIRYRVRFSNMHITISNNTLTDIEVIDFDVNAESAIGSESWPDSSASGQGLQLELFSSPSRTGGDFSDGRGSG